MARMLLLLAAISATALARTIPASAEARVTDAPMRRKVGERGIIPTTTGQIGINPVSSELGDPSGYRLTDLGPENTVVTYSGNTYHYIEGHTKYLTIETITTTVTAKPTTTTSEVKVVAHTATADGAGQKAGDISLTFSEDVADALRNTADDAIQACGLLPKKRSVIEREVQDSVRCVIDKAVSASGKNGPLEAVGSDQFWSELGVEVAEDATAYLLNATEKIATQQGKKKAYAILGTIIAGTTVEGAIAAVNFHNGEVGAGSETQETDPDKKCDPKKPLDQFSPLCSSKDCLGKLGRCSAGGNSKNGCPCVGEGTAQPPQQANRDWWDAQQKIIADIQADPKLVGGSMCNVSIPYSGVMATGCVATPTASTASTGSTAKPTPTCNSQRKFGIKKDSLISSGEKFCSDNNGKDLRTIPINPYSNAQTGFFDGATDDGKIYMFAYLDKGCNARNIDENDCKAAVHAIFDRCDASADTRMGGAASVNCQWYNMTGVDKCMGSSDSFANPGSCNVGSLPGGYGQWPLGTIPK